MIERFPPASTPTVTLHLTAEVDGPQHKSQGQGQGQGHAHAHFAPSPPSYHTAAGNIKSKAQKSSAQKDNSAPSALKNSSSKSSETNGSSPKAASKSNGNKESSGSVKLAPPLPPFTGQGSGGNGGGSTQKKIEDKKVNGDQKSDRKVSGDHKKSEKSQNGGQESKNGGETGGQNEGKSSRRAQSVMSTRSRKSRYGGDEDAEPMHVVHKRNWEAVSNSSLGIDQMLIAVPRQLGCQDYRWRSRRCAQW